MKTTQMTPIFHLLVTLFLNLKILKIHFEIHYSGPFWPAKYLNFSPKGTDRMAASEETLGND